MVSRLDVIDSDPARRRNDIDGDVFAARQGPRRSEPGADDRAGLLQQCQWHQPRLLLEGQRIAGQTAVDLAQAGQNEGGADIRMPGEGQLGLRGKDPHLGGMRRVFWRQHEGRFRQVELAGDRLHLRHRKPVGVQHHRQRIAAEPPVGKHIHGDEIDLHRPGPLNLSARGSPGLPA